MIGGIEKLPGFLMDYPLWVRILVPGLLGAVAIILVLFHPRAQAGGFLAHRPPFANRVNSVIAGAKNVDVVANWIPQWIMNESLETALQNGGEVRLFLMDPDSEALRRRGAALSPDANDFEYGRRQLESSLDRFRTLAVRVGPERFLKRTELYFRDEFPAVMIIRADNTYFVGKYFYNRSISDAYLLELSANAPKEIRDALHEEIGAMEDMSRPHPLDPGQGLINDGGLSD